jgi:hypothetical protein
MNPPSGDNSPTVQKPFMEVTEKDAYKEKIIAFVNPKSYEFIDFKNEKNLVFIFSGGLQGQVVFEQLRSQIGEENVYDLIKDHGPQKGLKENEQQRNLRIIG